MTMGFAEFLFVLVIWVVPAVLLFFLLYWTIRLAIRHEKRRVPSSREAADQKRRERVAVERAAQHRPRRRRSE